MLTQILLVSLLGMPMQNGEPGLAWDVSAFHHDESAPQVFAPSAEQARECPRKASVCFSSGGNGTAEGTVLRAGAEPMTVLARGAQMMAVGSPEVVASNQPWRVEMVANLQARATAAPIEVDVQDADDPASTANLFARVVWDVDTRPSSHLGMRFALSPDQGFDPSHSYRVRVLQHQGKAEKLLAEGEFHLE
jgi:hypothetical protein